MAAMKTVAEATVHFGFYEKLQGDLEFEVAFLDAVVPFPSSGKRISELPATTTNIQKCWQVAMCQQE